MKGSMGWRFWASMALSVVTLAASVAMLVRAFLPIEVASW